MSTSVPPRGGSSVTSGALPDAQALKRVFESEFKSLVEQAKSHLGNAGSFANRVADRNRERLSARPKLEAPPLDWTRS